MRRHIDKIRDADATDDCRTYPWHVKFVKHFHPPWLPAAFCVVAHAIARTMTGTVRMKVIEKRDVPATGSQGGEP